MSHTPVEIANQSKYCFNCRRVFSSEATVCPDDGMLLTDKDRLIGTVLDERYLIEELIGMGGMGAVYRANQTQLNRAVAIKILKTSLLIDQTYVLRFKREAAVVADFKHPNIASVYGFGMVPELNIVYMAMEFLDGLSVANLIATKEEIPLSRALNIITQVASGLAHAHKHGVIHRDLKPSNIVLVSKQNEDTVKIVDFGAAKLLHQHLEDQKLTRTGEIIGTLQYMSPEQLTGEDVDQRSDIYAFGKIIYDLVNHEGLIPQQLQRIIERCLETDPGQRYQTVEELRSDLSAIPSDTTLGATLVTLSHDEQSRDLLTRYQVITFISLIALVAVTIVLFNQPKSIQRETTEIPEKAKTALELVPTNPVATMQSSLIAQFDASNFTEAEKIAQAMIAQAPQPASYQEQTALLILDATRKMNIALNYPAARRIADQAIGMLDIKRSNNARIVSETFRSWANKLESIADYEDTFACAKEALLVYPDTPDATDCWRMIAVYYQNKHMLPELADAFAHAATIAKAHGDTQLALYYVAVQTEGLCDAGLSTEASKRLLEALQDLPDSDKSAGKAHILVSLMLVELRLNHIDKANEYASQALAILMSKRPSQAVGSKQRFIFVETKLADALDHLKRYHEERMLTQKALGEANDALMPNDPVYTQLRQILQNLEQANKH